MSVANFGSRPSPVIVKSFVAQALGDQANVTLFSIVVPALTAYTFTGNTPIRLVADVGQEVVGAGVTTFLPGGVAIPATSYLYSASTLGNQVNVVNPATAVFPLQGFIYNVSSEDTTVEFVINCNVDAGASSIVDNVLVYFVPTPVSGFDA
jgi:hypothetical protein